MWVFKLSQYLFLLNLCASNTLHKSLFSSEKNYQLQKLVKVLIEEIADNSRCLVTILDTYYRRRVDLAQIETFKFLPTYRIYVRENDEFTPPRQRIRRILEETTYLSCDVYLILISNGLQVANFLRYTEEERLINTRGKFIFMYDFQIFHVDMRYLWNRLINSIFIRHNFKLKRRLAGDKQLQKYEWIAVFEHVPAVTEDAKMFFDNQSDIEKNSNPLGVEFEMILIIAKVLNFKPTFYQPENVQSDRWGMSKNDTFTGLLGEAMDVAATFYLGDFYYNLRHLQILDLSWPYNTECLTFLTLESLTENSWKLLILSFRLYSWITVILTLLLAGFISFIIAQIYKRYIVTDENYNNEYTNTQILLQSKKLRVAQKQIPAIRGWKGLYLFEDAQNSILYTYSMLLQVSLPKLPEVWSLRIFIGVWWLYTILITTFYKASMTASLANSVKRETIDTIAQLVKSEVNVGSWSEETKEFFVNSSDINLKILSNRYVVVSDEQDAVAAVVNGSLCYYENSHVLVRERVKRQILEDEKSKDSTTVSQKKISEHNLHVMEECVVNMPISLGLDKNSPLKFKVDEIVKRIIEAGLVEKWINDITQQSKTLELKQEGNAPKAFIDISKLQGAAVALGIGYFTGALALGGELFYWKKFVIKNPNFSKYHMDVFYKKT
uniref:Ionotropic glutamate receptor C-terminal domain-containing protein n=1 Tax=Trichogramma kaykai TaxID=54128 RepID=A0ABD2WKC9_9HYME